MKSSYSSQIPGSLRRFPKPEKLPPLPSYQQVWQDMEQHLHAALQAAPEGSLEQKAARMEWTRAALINTHG